MTDTATATSSNLVRFGRRTSRGLLLGFSAARVACIAVAAAVFIPSLMFAGIVGAAVTAPAWAALLVAAFVPWAGRPIIETAPTAVHYLVRRTHQQTTFTVRPGQPRPAGTLALPGDAAALRWLSDAGTGAVMVHDPHEQTLTAVAHVSHPAYVLLSPDEQSRRVQGWGRALAGLAASGTCARVQILESAQPDSGRGMSDWWREHQSPDAGQWAVEQYDELMETKAPALDASGLFAGGEQHVCRVAHVRDRGQGLFVRVMHHDGARCRVREPAQRRRIPWQRQRSGWAGLARTDGIPRLPEGAAAQEVRRGGRGLDDGSPGPRHESRGQQADPERGGDGQADDARDKQGRDEHGCGGGDARDPRGREAKQQPAR